MTDAAGDGYAYGEAVLVSAARQQPVALPLPKQPPALDASQFRCQKNPACVRGFRHRGCPGACRLRTEEEAASLAQEEAQEAALQAPFTLREVVAAARSGGQSAPVGIGGIKANP